MLHKGETATIFFVAAVKANSKRHALLVLQCYPGRDKEQVQLKRLSQTDVFFLQEFCICSNLPLPTADAATFPVSGDGLRFVFFLFISKKSFNITPKRNSLLPSF